MKEQANPPELDELKREVASLKQKLERPPKDFWDKLGTISTLVSGILVTLIGFYATQVYNQRQRENEAARKDRELAVLQVQTVEKFFVHLSAGDETKKEAAIQAIAALGNAELATKLALTFRGSGSTAALSRIASLPDSRVAKSAEAALSELFSATRTSVVRIESAGRLIASGFFITSQGLVLTTAHVAAGLEPGKVQIKMANGNTVPASVQKIDRDRDLALLKAQTQGPVIPLKIVPATVALGSQVIALGQSVDAEWLATVGIVSASDMTIPEFGANRIAVTLKSLPGFSGAPVLNTQGSLIGIIQAYSSGSGLTFLIPMDAVRAAFTRELVDGA